MKIVPTYTATIYCGLQEGYSGPHHPYERALIVCRNLCDRIGLGMTVRPVDFVYTGGTEGGFAVDLINYPRFPSNPPAVKELALRLARHLLVVFNQERLTVVCGDETIMLEREAGDGRLLDGAS